MLEEVGPTKLSLRAVSERVGVSSTAAYHHYANRAELIGHLAAQGFRELGTALRLEDQDSTGLQKLRDACLAYFSFARNNPALYQLMFGPESTSDDMPLQYREARDEAFDELKRIMADILGQDAASAEGRRAALAAWSYTHGLASLVIHGVLHFPPRPPTPASSTPPCKASSTCSRRAKRALPRADWRSPCCPRQARL